MCSCLRQALHFKAGHSRLSIMYPSNNDLYQIDSNENTFFKISQSEKRENVEKGKHSTCFTKNISLHHTDHNTRPLDVPTLSPGPVFRPESFFDGPGAR